MSTSGTRFNLEDLAKEAGASVRTIRYYVQRGLLPPPTFRGRSTSYDEGHLLRLQAIRHLQTRYLPLEAIAGVLDGCDQEGLRKLAEGLSDRQLFVPSIEPVMNSNPEPLPKQDSGKAANWRRWELATGLELQISDMADARVRKLAQRLLDLARQEEETT